MIKKIRGFNDWILSDGESFLKAKRFLESSLFDSGYSYLELPLIEEKSLFDDSLGTKTDIVQKEMFEIKQRKENRSWVLRPEATAQVARMFIEKKLDKDISWKTRKFFYFGPFFRYERPQKERYRQFYSLGTEIYYQRDSSSRKYLILEMFHDLTKILNTKDLIIKVNFLPKNRGLYIDELRKYFSKNIDSLCDDCKTRLNKNVLRILDCKIDHNSSVIKKAPKIKSFLQKEDTDFFNEITALLKDNNIKFVVDRQLVRGLDYYNGFIFEIVEKDNETHAICGGGEYSGLLEKINKEMKNCNWNSMGYGIGMERAIKHLKPCDLKEKALVIRKTESKDFFKIRNSISEHYSVFVKNYSKSISKEINWAEQNNFQHFIIIGDEEVNKNKFLVRNLKTKKMEEFKWQA